MKSIMKVLQLVAIVLSSVVILVLIVGFLNGTVVDAIQKIFDTGPTGQVDASQTVVTGIKALGQLVSVEAQVAKADIEVHIQRGIADVCQFAAKHVAQGTLRAGIDLTRIEKSDVTFDEETNSYRITLPPAQLTSCSLDPVQTQQYFHVGDSPVCPIDWDEVRRLASFVALNEFRDDAIAGGLLDRAESQAVLVITQFINALNPDDASVNIDFAEGQDTIIPQTCAPKPPGRWYFDDELGRWLES